jgi:hypothetical protein
VLGGENKQQNGHNFSLIFQGEAFSQSDTVSPWLPLVVPAIRLSGESSSKRDLRSEQGGVSFSCSVPQESSPLLRSLSSPEPGVRLEQVLQEPYWKEVPLQA